jgi:DNA-binding MarR family transcriptional regulator
LMHDCIVQVDVRRKQVSRGAPELRIFTDASPGGCSDPSGQRHARRGTRAAPVDSLAVSDVDLADQIIRLVRTWSSLKAKMVSTVDPEVGTLFLLIRLIKDGPTRAKDLAEATSADQSTVSRQVGALVKAGLIERQADPDDGRASILVPTSSGRAKVNDHFANRGRAVEPLVADWSEDEREQFVQLLRRFNVTLDARRDDVVRTMAESHTGATAILPAPSTHAHSTEHQETKHQHAPSHPATVHPQASTERSN